MNSPNPSSPAASPPSSGPPAEDVETQLTRLTADVAELQRKLKPSHDAKQKLKCWRVMTFWTFVSSVVLVVLVEVMLFGGLTWRPDDTQIASFKHIALLIAIPLAALAAMAVVGAAQMNAPVDSKNFVGPIGVTILWILCFLTIFGALSITVRLDRIEGRRQPQPCIKALGIDGSELPGKAPRPGGSGGPGKARHAGECHRSLVI